MVVIAAVGSFPLTLTLLQQSKTGQKQIASSSRPETSARRSLQQEFSRLDQSIDSKVQEITAIDLKISDRRGEIQKLEVQQDKVIKDLEQLQERIQPLMEANSTTRSSVKR